MQRSIEQISIHHILNVSDVKSCVPCVRAYTKLNSMSTSSNTMSKKPNNRKKMVEHQRGHLSREMLAEAGLRVARRSGVDNLTMKKLAEEVSVTPMAIYRHFEDKADLIDAVLDTFVQEQDICGHGVDPEHWSEWLFETYKNMYVGLQSMPSVYPYLSSASRFGSGATEVVMQSLATLEDAGFSRDRATEIAQTLNGYIIGCAIMDGAFYENLGGMGIDLGGSQAPRPDTGLNLIISALKKRT